MRAPLTQHHAAGVAALLMLGPLAASAQPTPNGSQFQVNTYTTGKQEYASVASDSSGNFVVVWDSYSSGTTGYFVSLHGQRYNASGSPVGGEVQVNTYTTGFQERRPSVASDSFGDFVVVWERYG